MLTHLVKNELNEPKLIFCYTRLNGFKYFSQTRIFIFDINHLFAHSFICCFLALLILIKINHPYADGEVVTSIVI